MKAILMALLLVNTASLTAMQREKIRTVEKRLLAPCCYMQSVAEHGSEIAVRMRAEVTEMVAEGRTEEEIVSHYRGLYGDRILVLPEGIPGKVLFGLPVLALVLGCVVLFLRLRKMVSPGKEQFAPRLGQPPPAIKKPSRQETARERGEPF